MQGLMQTAFRERASKSTVQGMTFSVIAVAFDEKTLTKRLADVGAMRVDAAAGHPRTRCMGRG